MSEGSEFSYPEEPPLEGSCSSIDISEFSKEFSESDSPLSVYLSELDDSKARMNTAIFDFMRNGMPIDDINIIVTIEGNESAKQIGKIVSVALADNAMSAEEKVSWISNFFLNEEIERGSLFSVHHESYDGEKICSFKNYEDSLSGAFENQYTEEEMIAAAKSLYISVLNTDIQSLVSLGSIPHDPLIEESSRRITQLLSIGRELGRVAGKLTMISAAVAIGNTISRRR